MAKSKGSGSATKSTKVKAIKPKIEAVAEDEPDVESPVSAALREALRTDGRSVNAIAVEAGVSQSSLSRFISAGKDLKLSTGLAVMAVLGFEVTQRRKIG